MEGAVRFRLYTVDTGYILYGYRTDEKLYQSSLFLYRHGDPYVFYHLVRTL